MALNVTYWAMFRKSGIALNDTDLAGADIPEIVVRRRLIADGAFGTPLASTDMAYDTPSKQWYYTVSCDLVLYEYTATASTSYADADALDMGCLPYVSAARYATEFGYLDVAVTSRAATGAQMDLIDAPNATAVTAIQATLALEATLTAIKGAGWATETLVALQTAIDTILADTGTNGVVVGSHTTAAKAEIQVEAEDALRAYDLDHFIQVTAGSEEPTGGAYLDQIMHKSASQTFDDTTDSLEAVRDAVRSLSQFSAAANTLSTAGKLAAVAYTTYSEELSGTFVDGKTASLVTMTIKQNEADTDAQAVMQANSTTGLIVLNGTTTGVTAADASIAYDQNAGTVTPTIKDAAMAIIGMRHNLVYDIKIHYSDGESSRFSYGGFVIAATATRVVT